MENRKGNGIFLGIVSIATLIVAIIGATFAYFSASTESAENAVNAEAYEFKLTIDVEQIYPETANYLIPMDPTATIANAASPNNTNILYALNAAPTRCVDDHGLQVCALFRVAITNEGVNAMKLKGQLKTTSNVAGAGEGKSAFTDLTYHALTGTHNNSGTGTLALSGSPVTVAESTEEGSNTIDIADIDIPGSGTGYSYVLIYLNENGNQSSQMGAQYQGQLIYSSGEGEGAYTLTGTFTVSGGTENT